MQPDRTNEDLVVAPPAIVDVRAIMNVWVPRGILAALLLIVNGVVLAEAAKDRSWGALAMAVAVGPIANGVIAAFSVAFTPWVRRLTGTSPAAHVLISLVAPAAAILADCGLIFSMDLHGC